MRKFENWLLAYGEYTRKTEPPPHYHIWTGIYAIASALQRKTWLPFGRRRLFPNVYIILVSPPGKCRKNAAISLGTDLLKRVTGVKVTSESITREALIQFMAHSRGDLHYVGEEGPHSEQHCSISAVAKELGSFLGTKNPNLTTFLTDIFDCDDEWTYSTKKSGTDKILGPCLNLIGGITPDWLARNLPLETIGGGFSSRVIIVVGRKKAGKWTIPPDSPELRHMATLLVEDLERIATLAGPFRWNAEAYEFYDNWYQALDDENPSMEDPRFAGYLQRKPAYVLKAAMCLAVAQRDDLVLMPEDISRAIKLLDQLEPHMPDAFGGLGMYDRAVVIEQVMKQLITRGPMTKRDLLRLNYRDIDPDGLASVIKTLQMMDEVRVQDRGDGEPVYYITQKSPTKQ